jgi:hypothetical protein
MRQPFEAQKIYFAYTPVVHSDKEIIVDMITKEVLLHDAHLRNITISDDEIDAYVQKMLLLLRDADDLFFEDIETYLEKKGIDKEAYIQLQEEKYFNGAMRNLTLEKLEAILKEEYNDDIWEKALKSGEEPVMTYIEYRDKYIQNLLNKAEIEIYDSEIEQMLLKW